MQAMIHKPHKSFTQTWINDHLDLYNYAQSISDTEWQEEIIASMRRQDTLVQHELRRSARFELWRKFDSINLDMLELYHQLKSSQDEEQVEELRKKVWNLRLQRLEVVKQLHQGMK
jgi:hypothetical protein